MHAREQLCTILKFLQLSSTINGTNRWPMDADTTRLPSHLRQITCKCTNFRVCDIYISMYVSLTPTLVKLLESIVGAWMLERIENKLDVYQYGALKGRSTTHALVDMLHHWSKAIDEGHSARAVLSTSLKLSIMWIITL